MTNPKLKSIYEISADLRAKGELDENALARFKKKYDSFIQLHYVFGAVFILLSLGTVS